MKLIELEKFIQNQSTELYSFAFILIPDDLQATQLMIDSVSAFMIQNKSLIEKWSLKGESVVEHNPLDIKIHLYKSMFDLAKKRYQQVRMSFKSIEDNSGFFSLDFDDKAILFLKERTDLPFDVIEFITGQTRSEILAHLYSARMNLVKTQDNRTQLREAIIPHN